MYDGVQVIDTSLWDSFVGRLPLCLEDYRVEVVLENQTVFGGVLITGEIPPHLNLEISSSNCSCSSIRFLNVVGSTNS